MRAHILQHVPFESPGSIEPWLLAKGYETEVIHLYKSEPLPDPAITDLLVIMGGPMSVNDETGFQWLVAEKQFIRDCIKAGKPILGICLGAQLIASALGASVYPNPEKEIGWFTVQGIPAPVKPAFNFPSSFMAFHWHGDTFDLPPGAVHLARSEACENQAFQFGKNVIGLQFHLETTPVLLQEMVTHGRSEIIPAKFVQSETEILGVAQEKYLALNQLMREVLTFIFLL
jgi:GMP synthase-like glutamine amidotransferase